MKQKTMILIALAVVCGLGASFMTSKLLADRQQQEETIKVLVAKKNLDTGIMIKKPEEAFEEKEILKETAPKNALTKFDDVKGRQLKIPRRQGDNITQDDLYDDKGPGLMNTLPPGHRAVGIRVSSEQIAAGFAAVPHSRLDIALIVRGNNNDRDNFTRIILQNVLVLASGQATVRDEGGKAMMCDVVTVALTPEDALKLEMAKAKGNLTMLLRPFGESAKVQTGSITFADVLAKDRKDGRDDSDDGGSKGPGSGAPLEIVVPNTPAGPVQLTPVQPVNDKLIVRVTHGDKTEKWSFDKDAEGFYTSRVEPAEAAVSPGGAVPKTRPAGKQAGTAAPTPSSEKPKPNGAY